MNLNVLITTNLNKLQFHFGRIFQNELSAICCVPVNDSSVLTASPTCRMATFFLSKRNPFRPVLHSIPSILVRVNVNKEVTIWVTYAPRIDNRPDGTCNRRRGWQQCAIWSTFKQGAPATFHYFFQNKFQRPEIDLFFFSGRPNGENVKLTVSWIRTPLPCHVDGFSKN